jgi:hypothetical protein
MDAIKSRFGRAWRVGSELYRSPAVEEKAPINIDQFRQTERPLTPSNPTPPSKPTCAAAARHGLNAPGSAAEPVSPKT